MVLAVVGLAGFTSTVVVHLSARYLAHLSHQVLGGLGFDRDETKWRRCTMRRVLQQQGVDGGATREEQQQDKVDGIGLGPEQRRRSFWRLERPWASGARCHREVCEGAMSRRQRHCELQQRPRSWSTPPEDEAGAYPGGREGRRRWRSILPCPRRGLTGRDGVRRPGDGGALAMMGIGRGGASHRL